MTLLQQLARNRWFVVPAFELGTALTFLFVAWEIVHPSWVRIVCFVVGLAGALLSVVTYGYSRRPEREKSKREYEDHKMLRAALEEEAEEAVKAKATRSERPKERAASM